MSRAMQLAMSEQEVLALCASKKVAVSAIEPSRWWDPVGLLQLKRRGYRQAKSQIENYHLRAGTRKASSDLTLVVN